LPRRLGQHFLVRESILEKLAAAACGAHSHRVIEIGPGRGALTRKLLPRTDELHAIELDSVLIEHLGNVFATEPKLHLHAGDVLQTDLAQWGPAAIAGNLPYYITSPIVEKFLKLDHQFQVAVFLMQSEVAQRLMAQPGTRDYGYLTVVTRLICDVELVCQVPPAAFSPPPKVNSAGVRLVRRPQYPIELDSLRTLVSRSFAQKRKTLRNNLRPFYGPDVDRLPEAQLRAEQLSVDAFIDLHARLSARSREVH
jgi:16S rRNA (adenine1518-N6/adenine1519-N6)-dimethyltransferase